MISESYLKRLVKLAKPFSRYIAGISVLILVLSGLRQAEPLVLKHITDTIVGSGGVGQTTLPKTLVGFLAVYVTVKVLTVAVNRSSWYLASILSYKLRHSLKEKAFTHLLSLSMDFFSKKQSGQLMNQIERGSQQLTSMINNSGMFFFPNLLTAIIGVLVVSRYNAVIAASLVFAYIIVGFFNYQKFKRNQKLEKKEYRLYDRQYGHFWEVISAVKLIKTFTAELFESRHLERFNSKVMRLRYKTERNHNIFAFAEVFLETWIFGMFAYIVYLTYSGQFTLGTMFLMLSYMQIIREPLYSLNWMFWEFKRAQIGARDYFAILDQFSTVKEVKKPLKIENVRGDITFKNVSFAYPKSSSVLHDLTFTIPSGTTCAFVGRSGAGKTTVIDLINRFFDPQAGVVTLDGVNIRKLSLKNLRKQIGVVSQEAYLFGETIEENLRYGKPDATLEEMVSACKTANAHEFIMKLPKDYKTNLGERGVTLSGGQRQRLSLARVLLKNPPVLIMDEATSQLDSYSEALIQQALEHVTVGRTTIIIAHRLSTVKKADKIIVMDNGAIIEQGNHAMLLERKGIYSSLFSIQSGQDTTLSDWGLLNA